jgi:hypothetical protein
MLLFLKGRVLVRRLSFISTLVVERKSLCPPPLKPLFLYCAGYIVLGSQYALGILLVQPVETIHTLEVVPALTLIASSLRLY